MRGELTWPTTRGRSTQANGVRAKVLDVLNVAETRSSGLRHDALQQSGGDRDGEHYLPEIARTPLPPIGEPHDSEVR